MHCRGVLVVLIVLTSGCLTDPVAGAGIPCVKKPPAPTSGMLPIGEELYLSGGRVALFNSTSGIFRLLLYRSPPSGCDASPGIYVVERAYPIRTYEQFIPVAETQRVIDTHTFQDGGGNSVTYVYVTDAADGIDKVLTLQAMATSGVTFLSSTSTAIPYESTRPVAFDVASNLFGQAGLSWLAVHSDAPAILRPAGADAVDVHPIEQAGADTRAGAVFRDMDMRDGIVLAGERVRWWTGAGLATLEGAPTATAPLVGCGPVTFAAFGPVDSLPEAIEICPLGARVVDSMTSLVVPSVYEFGTARSIALVEFEQGTGYDLAVLTGSPSTVHVAANLRVMPPIHEMPRSKPLTIDAKFLVGGRFTGLTDQVFAFDRNGNHQCLVDSMTNGLLLCNDF